MIANVMQDAILNLILINKNAAPPKKVDKKLIIIINWEKKN